MVVELRSSDELAPAALALAPLNPSRHRGSLAFRFRVARRFGYGAAPEMARRCLERLDELGIPGELRLLEVLSDTQPVLTGTDVRGLRQGGLMLAIAERVRKIQERARSLALLQVELATIELKQGSGSASPLRSRLSPS